VSALVLRLKGQVRELADDPRRATLLGVGTLVVLLTAWVSQAIPATYPILFAGIIGGALTIYMLENQEKTLYLVLWFSTVYLTLKATVFGWSEAAFLFKDGFLALLFAFWFFHFLVREERLRPTPLNVPIAALTVWLLVQCFNPNTYGAMSILQDLRFWLTPIAIYVLTVQLVDSREKLERGLKFVFAYAFIEAVYGVSQQWMPGDLLVALGANPDSYFYFYHGTIRSFSTMGTVPFGLLASMFPVIGFFYMSQQRSDLHRAFFFGASFVFVAGVVFSLVRTAWISVTVSMFVYALLSRRWKILLVLLLVFMLVLTFSSGYMRWKLEGVLNPLEDESVRTRLTIAKVVTEGIVFRTFGYGLGTFAHNRWGAGQTDRIGYGTATENWYLMVSLEVGWIGMLLLLWIWFKTYRMAWRGWNGGLKTARYRELSLALMCSLLAIEVARLGGPAGYFPPDSWHYWFFLGLITVLPRADEELAAEELAAEKLAAEKAAAADATGVAVT